MGTRVTQATPLHFTDKSQAGVARLLDDLHRLMDDRDSADVVFLVGREEVPIYAHCLILRARSCTATARCRGGQKGGIAGSHVSCIPPLNSLEINMSKSKAVLFRSKNRYVTEGCKDLADFLLLSLSHLLHRIVAYGNCHFHSCLGLLLHDGAPVIDTAPKQNTRPSIRGRRGGTSYISALRGGAELTTPASRLAPNAIWSLAPREEGGHSLSPKCLAMEEEDVWRAVLSWAKHHAGVTQPTAHWTEEERARICQQLLGVINHVRLLLIDSQVFAEEVEPTGAVPMELTLERYRYAALPSKFTHLEERHLQPRTSLRFFQGSQLLTGHKLRLQQVLNAWYGSPKQVWRLLYRASNHGYSAESFHHMCDGHSPTFVIVLGSPGQLCGGFSDVPWGKTGGRGRYIPSEKAFLFTLINNADMPPTKFDIVKKMFAISHHPEYGPIFGAGADLSIANHCNSNMESYSNLPHSYDGEGASCTLLMGDYNFSVLDYEVFTTLGK
ncbi:unnamed protein product [Ixodes persulcatus]